MMFQCRFILGKNVPFLVNDVDKGRLCMCGGREISVFPLNFVVNLEFILNKVLKNMESKYHHTLEANRRKHILQNKEIN